MQKLANMKGTSIPSRGNESLSWQTQQGPGTVGKLASLRISTWEIGPCVILRTSVCSTKPLTLSWPHKRKLVHQGPVAVGLGKTFRRLPEPNHRRHESWCAPCGAVFASWGWTKTCGEVHYTSCRRHASYRTSKQHSPKHVRVYAYFLNIV